MTWATTAPTWLFISVTPHWLEAVLSDLNGDSAVLNLGVVTGPAPSGTSRCSSVRMPANRFLAASRLSSNRGGLTSVCDHSGCSLRAASMALGTHFASQPLMVALLWSANSRSVVSRPNIAVV